VRATKNGREAKRRHHCLQQTRPAASRDFVEVDDRAAAPLYEVADSRDPGRASVHPGPRPSKREEVDHSEAASFRRNQA
jgi:hypothetical protein